ncbi:pyridoxal phosphate-dependent transferase [Fimicolochytrium jonesii]|uniref:pyridoxal phosphate-dependent transferase n=1 Tax=Fimicolochytrium jonesii TaxID=1396493 RepID=UPI0022FE4196|nr:pyridoxal phosphate-dependent transferase [Fimicolochytrium jonesii]KAI8821385.1 pyridoxal phosphate-dependent transferase [Fimicolochytrium jonesii]
MSGLPSSDIVKLVWARIAGSPAVAHLKNAVFAIVLYRYLTTVGRDISYKGPVGAFKAYFKRALQYVLTLSRKVIPGANSLVKKEVAKHVEGIEKKMVNIQPGTKVYRALPAEGLSDGAVRSELERYQKMGHVNWRDGKISGAIYHGGEDVSALITDAFSRFTITNPLHPEIFPGIRQMEAEVVSMVLRMYNAPDSGCGSVTSGGTESLLMAIKAYRDMARDQRGVTEPEMVVPVTIHAAFDKGESYFGVKLIHIPIDSTTGKVDLAKVGRAINRNTILIAGSAPNFPHGIIDDIPALAALAKKAGIGMHVDCCLGGFIVPFVEKAGFPLDHPCDFRVDGVTSISVDTHKYGFAPKGSSVIMYRDKSYRDYQYFVATEWTGGIYASPTIAGSRPGALIAGCWAAMVHFGESGYVKSTKEIMTSARRIREGIKNISGLKIVGNPILSVVAFQAEAPINTYAVADLLSRKDWHLNVLQNPPAIHIACTMLTRNSAEELLRDLDEAIMEIRRDPAAGQGAVAAIYGTAASVPDRTIIADVTKGFLDALTKI